MKTEITANREVDAFGLLCPMPVIKTAEAVKDAQVGDLIKITATDPGFPKDIEDWCRANRHSCLQILRKGRLIIAWIRKENNGIS